jgi:uncharacterized repeat protein (TIGR01451 family)
MRSLVTSLVIVLAATVGVAQAQPTSKPGSVELRNIAEKEVPAADANGKPVTRRVPAAKAAPGEEVIYTSSFKNTGSKPAGDIAVTNPIPANTTYVGGSAYGDNTTISFSADGGKSWGPANKLKVRGADGNERPAAVSEITHVRWTYRGELPVGKESSVGFRVTVN